MLTDTGFRALFGLAAATFTLSPIYFYRPAVFSLQSEPAPFHPGGRPVYDSPIGIDKPAEGSLPSSEHWTEKALLFPVKTYASLPTGRAKLPSSLQHDFTADNDFEEERWEVDGDSTGASSAQDRVKAMFRKAWSSYRDRAWGHDELLPVAGGFSDPYNGWGTTLLDSLDTLWIMGMKDEFEDAVDAVTGIDFANSSRSDIPVAAATTRHLGALLSAYDISGGAYPVLLEKAAALGDILLYAFDTLNHLPTNRLDRDLESETMPDSAPSTTSPAELGLSLEFTRLAQLTGEMKYFDAVDRVLDALSVWNKQSSLPGLLPSAIDASGCATLGTSPSHCKTGSYSTLEEAESRYSFAEDGTLYSTLLKQYILLGGMQKKCKTLYTGALDKIKEKLLFRPLAGGSPDILMIGEQYVSSSSSWWPSRDRSTFEARVERSSCSAGAMFALGSVAVTQGSDELDIARKLTAGCIWAHETSRSRLSPTKFLMMACENRNDCPWEVDQLHAWWDELDLRLHDSFDAEEYPDYYLEEGDDTAGGDFERSYIRGQKRDSARHSRYNPLRSETVTRPALALAHEDFVRLRIWEEGLAEGMLDIEDRRYTLGHETIESIFTLYRITGEQQWREAGMRILDAVEEMTSTQYGNAHLADVTVSSPNQKQLEDVMDSRWMGATLKYFFLLFSEPGVISLDQWVFGAAGHAFKLPK